jgi:hypothetical protein
VEEDTIPLRLNLDGYSQIIWGFGALFVSLPFLLAEKKMMENQSGPDDSVLVLWLNMICLHSECLSSDS